MTASPELLAVLLLIAECTTVDRCLLARSIGRYSSSEISAAELQQQLSPAVVPCDPSCTAATADEFFYSALQGLLPALGHRLNAGDEGAWQVGFGLRRFVDGGLLEDLDATLAGAIGAQPRLFLRAVGKPAEEKAVRVVLFLGEAYVDRGKGVRCRAYRDRLASVRAVADKELQEVRAAATRILTAALEPCE